MLKITLVAGARPNFMKIAPIVRELKEKVKAKVKEEEENGIEWRSRI